MGSSSAKEQTVQALVLKALSKGELNDALNHLHLFVDCIINNPENTSRVLSSDKSDFLCKAISEYALQRYECNLSVEEKSPSTVLILSEIIESGGHIELLKDYLKLQVFPKPTILVTDIFSRQKTEVVKKFSEILNVDVHVSTGIDAKEKFECVINFLRDLNCKNIVLLNHHQDSTAISAALTQKNCNIYFIHHADHQFSLGVTCKDFIHIDLHNVAFAECRHALGIKNNKYWPIVARKFNREEQLPRSFLADGFLKTCSSGNYRKFEADSYLYDYFEILPKILSITGGKHIHIGELSVEVLNKLRKNFNRQNVSWSQFEHIRRVPSLAAEILSQSIDLYISSFPLAGAKTMIEVMSVGTPLLMHENYRARLSGCCDLAYSEAFVWRNEEELFGILKGLSSRALEKHSEWALKHFARYHTEKVLIEAVEDLNIQNAEKIPKLREYYPDMMQVHLDEMSSRDSKIELLRNELDRVKVESSTEIERVTQEWSNAAKLVEEIKGDVRLRDRAISELTQQIELIRGSISWKATAPLRRIRRLFVSVGLEKTYFQVVLKQIKNFAKVLYCPLDVEDDFDETFYCALYPDILKNGVDPLEHFRRHGKAEGRLGKPPSLDIQGVFEDFNTKLETVIVVTHEATLTGAPILAKNIVDDLGKRYNVIVIMLNGGPLSDGFHKKGILRVLAPAARNNELIADYMVSELIQDRRIKFAIVNTIESSSVLPVLAKKGIPIVSLIHEFASSVQNKEGFRKSYFWSDQVVFSSKITHENLVKELPELKNKPVNILPQGKCSTKEISNSGLFDESRNKLQHFFEAQNEESLVVLGIGTLYYRKGVDLFIQCASRLKQLKPEKEFVFVWIGRNVDEELNTDYFSYLSDQIQRNDLQNNVFFFGETGDIEFAYKSADIFLLTSRLDPLPNVAIDALFNGVPVLCFDKASGIADILIEEGLEDACVASFLDVNSMAEKLLKLANSKEYLQHTKRQCQNFSHVRFNLANYVLELERIADLAAITKTQLLNDISEIQKSQLFRFDFATAAHWKGLGDDEIIAAYVRSWRSGIDLRKPMPGFHPGIYKEKHGVANPNGDPFADFIREGCPSGFWSTPVLALNKDGLKNTPCEFKVALHIHVFYPQLLNQILKRIEVNKIRPDLFISVPNLEAKNKVVSLLSKYKGKIGAIVVVPNQGRDIGPLLTQFGGVLVEGYDVIGHIHTKVSPHAGNIVGAKWSDFLLENLLGGDGGPVADNILAAMYENPSIGLVFPDDPHPIGWDKNLMHALSLAKRLNLTDTLDKNLNFPVGTMFWARKEKLAPLVQLGFSWAEYPQEPLPIDGTVLHAIERILPSVSPEMKSLLINIPNVSR